MTTEITDYIDVTKKIEELGLVQPVGISFLPANFEDADTAENLVVRGEATTLKKVLLAGDLEISILQDSDSGIKYVHNKSHDWAMPLMLFTAEAMTTNPDLVSLAIDLVKNYVTDLFKGLARDKTIKAEIVVEKTKKGTFQKITYEGDPEGLSLLVEMARDIHGQS